MQKGTINVGTYDFGSGPVAEVSFDTSSEYSPKSVWIETGSDNWVAIDERFTDELCRAIRKAAKAIRAATATKGQSND